MFFVFRLLSSSPVKRSVLYYILPTLATASLINVGKFFEVETVTYCMDFTACGCGYHQVQTEKYQIFIQSCPEMKGQTFADTLCPIIYVCDCIFRLWQCSQLSWGWARTTSSGTPPGPGCWWPPSDPSSSSPSSTTSSGADWSRPSRAWESWLSLCLT